MGLFWLLRWLYPPSRRRRFGAEMEAVERVRGERARAEGRVAAWWIGQLRDALVAVPAAWVTAATRRVTTKNGGWTMGGVTRDLRQGLRSLRRAPGFAAFSILTLGLGIGAATALFSVVDPLLLKPLGYPAPERIVGLWAASPGSDVEKDWLAPAHYRWLAERMTTVELVTLVGGGQTPAAAEGADPEFWNTLQTSATLVPLMGLRAGLGRLFQEGDDAADAPLLAVLSHRTWVDRFGSDPDIVGTAVRIGGEAFEIIGVVADDTPLIPEALPSVGNLSSIDLLVNFQLDTEFLSNTGGWNFNVMARARAGLTPADVDAELDRLTRGDFASEFEIDDPAFHVFAVGLIDEVVGPLRPLALALLGAVALLLVVSCGNVATLLVARGATRRREVAVRRAIGAERARIVRQMAAEGLLLAGAAGVVGVAVGRWGLELFQRFGPSDLPRLAEMSLNGRVLVFAALASLATTVLFGLLPALRATAVGPSETLRSGDRSAVGHAGGLRVRPSIGTGIAAVQVALSLVLLVSATLLVHSYTTVRTVDPGFETDGVMTLRFDMGAVVPRDDRVGRVTDLLREVHALPGVEAAGLGNLIPLGSSVAWGGISLSDVDTPVTAEFRTVTPGYFEAMGIAVTAGRSFGESDMAGDSVVIVDRALVDRYWPGRDPLGLRAGFGEDSLRVVGVVSDVRQYTLERASERAFVYYPYALVPVGRMYLAVRTTGSADALVAPVSRIVRGVMPGAPIGEVRTMGALVSGALATRRTGAWLMGAFALIALVLCLTGTYGLISYRVASSRPEIGLRMALGARPADVMGLVTRFGLGIALFGMAIGMPGAWMAGGLLRSQLVGASPVRLWAIAVGAVLLGSAAVGAALIPARRAARIDPSEAFRSE